MPGADDLPLEALAGMSADKRQTFELRVRRWWDDLHSGLADVYDPVAVTGLEARLLQLAAACFAERDPRLHRLDEARTLDPGWFQSPGMLGYACYADRFAG